MLKYFYYASIIFASTSFADETKHKDSTFKQFINFITKHIPVIGFSIEKALDISDNLKEKSLISLQQISDSQNTKYPIKSFLDSIENNGFDFYMLNAPGFDFQNINGIKTLNVGEGSILFNDFIFQLNMDEHSEEGVNPPSAHDFERSAESKNQPRIKILPQTLALVEMKGNALTVDFGVVDTKKGNLGKMYQALRFDRNSYCSKNSNYCLMVSKGLYPELQLGGYVKSKKIKKASPLLVTEASPLVETEPLVVQDEALSEIDKKCKVQSSKSKSFVGAEPPFILFLNKIFKIISEFVIMNIVNFLVQPQINIKRIEIPDLRNLTNQYMEVEIIISAFHVRLTVLKPKIPLCLKELVN